MTRTFARRQFLQALGGGTAAILIAACAGGQPASAPGGASSSAPTAPARPADTPAQAGAPAQPAAKASGTGTFWFNQPPQQEAFQKIIERFNTSGSGAKMEVVLVPANDLPAKLATAIAGGEPPDAVRLGGPAVNSLFITNGHAAALDDWDPKVGTYDWIPTVKQAVTRNGKMYAMPVNSGVQALIYNTEVYQKAGLDPEKPPKTFAELLETAGKVADFGKGEIWGHYLLTAPTSQTGSDYFTSVLWAFGGKEVNEDSSKVIFNSPEGVEALAWYKSMFARKVMPIKQVNETQMLQDYLTGNVGSMGATPALLANVSGASFKSASARLPAGPKSQVATIGFGTIMVMDKGKNREAGWAFARFIGLEPANGAFWNISFGQLPPRLSFREDPAWKEHEAKNPLVPPYVESQKSTELAYCGPGAQEMGTEVGKAVEAVAFGKKEPRQAMDDAAQAAQVILDRERKKG
jgi:ABC-type glycerol-3-phosphate transport system substrate-binding protein